MQGNMSRPARGAWIEMVLMRQTSRIIQRRAPQGARGLKFGIDFTGAG